MDIAPFILNYINGRSTPTRHIMELLLGEDSRNLLCVFKSLDIT